MPYIKVETNVDITKEQALDTLNQLSAAVAAVTGKPEIYIQAGLQGGIAMLMAGEPGPTAHVEVKGIGFPETQARPMSEKVTDILTEAFGIPGKRVHITFDAYEGSMWGVDGSTF